MAAPGRGRRPAEARSPVHEILDNLPPGALVLDLCSARGSFDSRQYQFRTICLDLEARQENRSSHFVQGEAVRLPFRSDSFDAVIANHALEHLDPLKPALQEMGRVLKRTGAAYVAVPDARRFCDRLYRKVFRNRGGHVNLFGSGTELAKMLAWYLGLPHAGTRQLYSSFVYLNRENFRGRPDKRAQLRAGPLPEAAVLMLTGVLARLDRWNGGSLGVYGWALYFGSIPGGVEPVPDLNVCVRCGAALPSHAARTAGWPFPLLKCPYCGGRAVDRARILWGNHPMEKSK
jgi:SAM-dependent methyltransferase